MSAELKQTLLELAHNDMQYVNMGCANVLGRLAAEAPRCWVTLWAVSQTNDFECRVNSRTRR